MSNLKNTFIEHNQREKKKTKCKHLINTANVATCLFKVLFIESIEALILCVCMRLCVTVFHWVCVNVLACVRVCGLNIRTKNIHSHIWR